MTGKIPILSTLIPLSGILLAGCTTTQVGYDGLCPDRPELEGNSETTQKGSADLILSLIDDQTDPELALRIQIAADWERLKQADVIRISTDNQLRLKQHIVDLEDLSGCTQN